ncbi:MAG TPA: 50S ribosomal protein L1 [Bacteroidia bacterium]|jgi:large subunit ribosomal protein L1|nr:50S ribosomal protein L1 [Bacteroidia bacterium]
MAKLSKKRKAALSKYDINKAYQLVDAAKILKEITTTKFDSSVELNVRLGIDVKQANQMVRGTVSLPHGTGKDVRVLVLCNPDKEDEAKAAGADFVGLDEFITKIKAGWTDIDVVIATPAVMGKVGGLGKILGPRGLMPNPKIGTVTQEVGKAVKESKAGKIEYKADKDGIVHVSVGKVSFKDQQIAENANEFIQTIVKAKPAASKGAYIRSMFMSSTMSPSIIIETKQFGSNI